MTKKQGALVYAVCAAIMIGGSIASCIYEGSKIGPIYVTGYVIWAFGMIAYILFT